jgi:hypothetical protein
MRKILVAYADENMQYSSKLLAFQAKLLNIFDNVILYNPDTLPDYIKKSSLMKYKKGGGYWAWKPSIIWETLQKFEDGDIVCYIDSGCTLHPGALWKEIFRKMKTYDTVCFQYSNEIPSWSKFGTSCSKIKYWTKKKTLLFFDELLKNSEYREFDKIMGGVVFCKGKNNQFIKKWLDITINFPELIIDPNQNELFDQYDYFTGYHRHDQSIITPLAYLYKDSNLCVLPEKFDEAERDNIIVASRLRVTDKQQYNKLRMYLLFHIWNNKKWYHYLKIIIRKF